MDIGKLYIRLKKVADEKCWSDDPDFAVCDYADGNIDDAYGGGYDSGQIRLARSLMKEFFPDVKKDKS